MTRPPDIGTNRRRINQTRDRTTNLERRFGGSGPRMVYGSFYGNSPTDIVNPGSGDWSLSGTPDGQTATITFDTPFANPPVVTVTPGAGNDAPQMPMVNADTDGGEFTDHFTVSAFIPQIGGGAFDDGSIDACGFYFIAVGI